MPLFSYNTLIYDINGAPLNYNCALIFHLFVLLDCSEMMIVTHEHILQIHIDLLFYNINSQE